MNKISNLLCLSLLLLGVTALGMDNSEIQLIGAAWEGDLKEVKRLITQGTAVDAKDGNGWTSLFWAVSNGDVAMCRLLIVNKASVDAKDDNGWTPLSWAAKKGNWIMCGLLIANKASVDSKSPVGWTPLRIAAFNGKEDACRLLIANKASIDMKCIHGGTHLVCAARNDHEDVCRLLIDVELEPARKNKAAIVTFLGIVRKRKTNLPCYMHYDVAKIIDRMAFAIVRQKNRSVIEQINKLGRAKAKWLAYLNQKLNEPIK